MWLLTRLGRASAVLAVLAAACSSSTVSTTTTTAQAPTSTTTQPSPTTTTTLTTTTTTEAPPDPYGGVAVIGLSAEPATLNPFYAGDDRDTVGIISQAWTVGAQDISGATGELIPEVVAQLPRVDNGGVVVNDDGSMTVTYEIRDEARWADGVPITGRDFQFTLDTILDPTLSISRGVYADIISSTVADNTFSFTLAFPTIEYEHLFDVLIPEHVVAGSDFATDWNDRTWVSGGPFVLEDWVPGEALVFRRNDAYWKADVDTRAALPYLDGVEFRFIDNPTGRLLAFAGHRLDVMEADIETAASELALTLEGEGAAVAATNGPVWVHLNFQFGPGRWDRNPDTLNEYLSFRQAIMHAVDRQRIVSELFGGRVAPLGSYVTAYNPAISGDAWAQYAYDPERARQLLEEAIEARAATVDGAAEDVILFFTANAGNPQRAAVAHLLGEMFTDAGIAYVETLEDPMVFFGETVSGGRWDVGMWAWQAAPGYASLTAFHDVLDPADSNTLTNFYRWGTDDSSVHNDWTQRYEEILAAMKGTVDHDELTNLIRDAERLIADQALFLPLYAEPFVTVYWPQQIAGFTMNTGMTFTWNLERWQSET
ncbi:MAG: ABC transporter substrate-binding protein [Acidimicrobiia bacterium]